ncbi:uncharacterized protein LOC113232317 isoform X2 [Hyposmocoma kahamanoa]|uniref:uncharacterized protein LOC113232317 isoform X2 n=1 Tax=Hyposmocoma kahamanoa TaxID=1477025 RepID=UPI000E6D87FF|nr:uncharacterized protein LOC113232317 isoform X2 [Hyposmocoma kahamanoa]
MWGKQFFDIALVIFVTSLCAVVCAPQKFNTKSFKVGIEYDRSLPMTGGSDRYRHRNNCDPFFVTVNVTAKKGYVISYLEASITVDELGEADFILKEGRAGSKYMIFQMVSNHSEFLSYSYMTYGIKDEEYKKVADATLTNAHTPC